MRILIVEDEQKAGVYIKKGSRKAGYLVDVVGDGAEGLILGRKGDGRDRECAIARASGASVVCAPHARA